MKEAAGEANMTVVTIIIIGVVMAIATPIIKGLVQQTKERGECINNGGSWNGQAGCDYTAGNTTAPTK